MMSAGMRAISALKSFTLAVCWDGFLGRIQGTMTFFSPER